MPITITIIESDIRIVAGIPKTITLETNIPSTIFYTLDGTTPTLSSDVAIGPIEMPGDEGTVVLNTFATDGTTTSTVITQSFGTTISYNRRPYSKIEPGFGLEKCPPFPFSSLLSKFQGTGSRYLGVAGITVDNPLLPEIPDGYDGTATGTPSNYTNQSIFSYDNIFSLTNAIGETGKGIGTLPAGVTAISDDYNSPIHYSNTASALFNPQALVIYQDDRDEPYDPNIPMVNRPYFSLENTNTARDGMLKQTSDVQPPTGSALRQFYNSRDNTIQFSYFDSRTNRWIISTVPYIPNSSSIGNYTGVIFPSSRENGGRFVFKWIPFQYRTLI